MEALLDFGVDEFGVSYNSMRQENICLNKLGGMHFLCFFFFNFNLLQLIKINQPFTTAYITLGYDCYPMVYCRSWT